MMLLVGQPLSNQMAPTKPGVPPRPEAPKRSWSNIAHQRQQHCSVAQNSDEGGVAMCRAVTAQRKGATRWQKTATWHRDPIEQQ